MKTLIAIFTFFNIILTTKAGAFVPEKTKKPLRFFLLECHSAAAADIISIFEELGHEVVYWSISLYSKRIFGHDNHPVEIINEATWKNINPELSEQFYNRYADFLNEFDGFIVTGVSSFALLYAKADKPIVIINSCRYEVPFTDKKDLWNTLDEYLIEGVNKGKIFLVANNIADAKYLEHYTGLKSEVIPSLCLYTKAEYTGKNNAFVVHNPRNNPLIKRIEASLENSELIKPYPKNFKSFQTLYDYKGIIHVPYQISIMALFEQYSANVPLFFPSKEHLFTLKKNNPKFVLNELSFFWLFNSTPCPTDPGNLNNTRDPNVLKFWIDSADFYDEENMPYIQYYDSNKHLKQLLQTVDLKEISEKMKAHNLKKKEMVLSKWEQLLDRVGASLR